MTRWEVLGRRRPGDGWEPVGIVHAPDTEMALLLAKESFFRHGEGVDLAVARGGELVPLGDPDLMAFATDKSYKLQRGYTGLGHKRRRAMARAQAAGAVRDHLRPVDLRVLNPEHRDQTADGPAAPRPRDQTADGPAAPRHRDQTADGPAAPRPRDQSAPGDPQAPGQRS